MQKRELDAKDFEFFVGLPDDNDEFLHSWSSESLTKATLQMPGDVPFFSLFHQNPAFSYCLKHKESGKIVALSGTQSLKYYCNRILEVGPELLKSTTMSNEAKKLIKMNIDSIPSDVKLPDNYMAVHNAGLLVEQNYRGCQINGMSVGEYLFKAKLEWLTKIARKLGFNGLILFTNANNEGSARIFRKYMKLRKCVDYATLEINHPGSFSSFVYQSD